MRAEYHALIRRKQLNSCVIVPVPQRRETETRLYGGGKSLLRTRLCKIPDIGKYTGNFHTFPTDPDPTKLQVPINRAIFSLRSNPEIHNRELSGYKASTIHDGPACLQPLLMHISNLQVSGLFAQLTDPGHVRLQLSPVTAQDTDSDYRPLPFILTGHLGNRGVEAGTQAILQTTHGTALVLQGPGPWNHQFDGK